MDIAAERQALAKTLKREPTDEELVNYLNHPGDALKTIEFVEKFGDPNLVPLDVWFEGLEKDETVHFNDASGKPHKMRVLNISEPDDAGMCVVRYSFDSEVFSHQVKVQEGQTADAGGLEMADPSNPMHVAAPSNGDLWIMHASPGEIVSKGEELFNISIMKQEKAVYAPEDGVVKRVLKSANFQEDKKMLPVVEGELLVELGPVPRRCPSCEEPVAGKDFRYCPHCGAGVES
jgi:pyruvate carboxylase